MCLQATELAELTSKISLLEDAKKKKEDEALEWQTKVNGYLSTGASQQLTVEHAS